MSLLFYQWNNERSYKAEIKHIFGKEVISIELRSSYNHMPSITIKEQQKIMMMKDWLLNARGSKGFNFAPYPEALDKLVIILSSKEQIIINISPPDPARSKIRYKSYVMFSTPPPNIIDEVRHWKKAYENRTTDFFK